MLYCITAYNILHWPIDSVFLSKYICEACFPLGFIVPFRSTNLAQTVYNYVKKMFDNNYSLSHVHSCLALDTLIN